MSFQLLHKVSNKLMLSIYPTLATNDDWSGRQYVGEKCKLGKRINRYVNANRGVNCFYVRSYPSTALPATKLQRHRKGRSKFLLASQVASPPGE